MNFKYQKCQEQSSVLYSSTDILTDTESSKKVLDSISPQVHQCRVHECTLVHHCRVQKPLHRVFEVFA